MLYGYFTIICTAGKPSFNLEEKLKNMNLEEIKAMRGHATSAKARRLLRKN